MKPKKSKIVLKSTETQAQSLREKAKCIAHYYEPLLDKDSSAEKTQDLLQELNVHKIELEMQNEELRQGKNELAIEKERYFELYELAPVGYCTLNEEGEILQANFSITSLLGFPKSALIQHLITEFIIYEDQDICYLHRKKLLETHQAQTYEIRMLSSLTL
jgi:PAS domain-containing protein